MRHQVISPHLTRITYDERPKPIPFCPTTKNWPLVLGDDVKQPYEIKHSRMYALNLMLGSELIENAQTLSQRNEASVLGEKTPKLIKFFLEIFSTVDPTSRMGDGSPGILYFLEMLVRRKPSEIPDDKLHEHKADPVPEDEVLLPDVDRVAGYRLIVAVNAMHFDSTARINEIFTANKAIAEERAKQNKSFKSSDLMLDIWDLDALLSLTDGFSARPIPNSVLKPLNEDGHPLNIDRRLSLRNALRFSNTVQRLQRIPDSYFSGAMPIFPDHNLVIRLVGSEFKHDTLINLELPTPTSLANKEVTHKDFRDFEHRFGHNPGEYFEPQGLEGQMSTPEETFQATWGCASVSYAGFTAFDMEKSLRAQRKAINLEMSKKLDSIKKRKCAPEERKQLLSNWTDVKQAKFDRFYEHAFAQFGRIWNVNSPVSHYVRLGIEYFEQYVKKHGTLYRAKSRLTEDLSTTQELLVSFLVDMEVLMDLLFSHEQALRAYLCVLDAQSCRREDKAHWLALGEHGQSKSHVLNLMTKLSIAGTVETMTYNTLKSDTVGDFDHSVRILHEMPQAVMELNSAGAVAPTPEGQHMKDITTRGMVTFTECIVNAREKSRIVNCWTINANRNYLCASNFRASGPITDRFRKERFRNTKRDDKTIQDLVCNERPLEFSFLEEALIDEYHYMHMMHIYLGQLIESGVFIDAKTPYCNMMLPLVLKKAREMNLVLSLESPRATKRFQALARVLVRWRAIFLTYCSPLSPFRGKQKLSDPNDPNSVTGIYEGAPYEITQAIAMQYRLVDDDERLFTSLLGLLRSDFEEDSYAFIEGINEADINAMKQAERDQTNPLVAEVEANTDCKQEDADCKSTEVKTEEHADQIDPAQLAMRVVTCKQMGDFYEVGGLFADKTFASAKIHLLADRWKSYINPRPPMDELIDKITAMTKTFRKIRDEDGDEVPVLEFTSTGYRILCAVIDDNREDRLLDAMKDVISHSQSNSDDLHLFGSGSTGKNDFCDFKLVRIEAKPDKVLEIPNINYYIPQRLEMARSHFVNNPTLDSMFSSNFKPQPKIRVDQCPLGEQKLMEFYAEIGVSPKRLMQFNIWPERETVARIIKECKKLKREYDERRKLAEQKYIDDPDAEILIQEQTGPKPIELCKYDPDTFRALREQSANVALQPERSVFLDMYADYLSHLSYQHVPSDCSNNQDEQKPQSSESEQKPQEPDGEDDDSTVIIEEVDHVEEQPVMRSPAHETANRRKRRRENDTVEQHKRSRT